MRRFFVIAGAGIVIGAALTGCASAPLPQETLGRLDMNDVNYNTEACLQARNIAMTYEDKHITRTLLSGNFSVGAGLDFLAAAAATPAYGVSVLYGLGGGADLLLNHSIEKNQKIKQEAVVAEIYRRCRSGVRVSDRAPGGLPYLPPGPASGPITLNGVVYTPYQAH